MWPNHFLAMMETEDQKDIKTVPELIGIGPLPLFQRLSAGRRFKFRLYVFMFCKQKFE